MHRVETRGLLGRDRPDTKNKCRDLVPPGSKRIRVHFSRECSPIKRTHSGPKDHPSRNARSGRGHRFDDVQRLLEDSRGRTRPGNIRQAEALSSFHGPREHLRPLVSSREDRPGAGSPRGISGPALSSRRPETGRLVQIPVRNSVRNHGIAHRRLAARHRTRDGPSRMAGPRARACRRPSSRSSARRTAATPTSWSYPRSPAPSTARR